MADRHHGFRRFFRLPWRSRETIRDDVDEEIAFHLDMRTEELVSRHGMDPEEARERAEREFGDVDAAKRELRGEDEEIERRSRWRAWLDGLRRDLVFALRTLGKRPGFAAVVVLTLALGIGGTTAVFSVVRAVLIEPLPYAQPGQLVRLYQYDIEEPGENLYVSGPHFREYRRRASSFQGLATFYDYTETGVDLMVAGRPERVRVLEVSSGYFRVLGREPLRGRTFTRRDEVGRPLAIVSERLSRRLGRERAALGASLELDGEPHTVVGVMSADFESPAVGRVDIWVPENIHRDGAQYAGNHFLSVIGRLAPGATPADARREMAALDRALLEMYPDVDNDGGFRLVPLHEDVVGEAKPTLLLLLGAVGMVLLLACVNVANLLMVRALGRDREMAVRAALGAGRARLARQLLTESLVLAVVGGLAGVFVAVVGIDALLLVGRGAIPRAAEVGLDAPVLGFAAAVTLVTGIAFGLAPALRLAGTPPAGTLRDASRGSSGGRRYARVRTGSVAGQVALALMLLMGASVLAASVYRLSSVDLGVRTDDVLTFELNLPGGRYAPEARAAFHGRMTDRLGRLPGVAAAAATSRRPALGTYYGWGTRPLTGRRAGDEEAMVDAQQRVVEGDYFEALGIPLLEGRVFDDRDRAESLPVAVVSRRLSEQLFPGGSALGQRTLGGGVEREIVGVVGNVAENPEGRPTAHVYHAHRQFSGRNWAMKYVIAAERDAESLIPAVRREIAAVDPELVMHEPATLNEVLRRSRGQRRFAFVLTAVFAGLALTLALLGLYGVLAYTVRQRTGEIGIRIALGAAPRRVARMVVRQGLVVTGIGLVLGVVGALALGRVLSSLVFQTEPTDPLILVAAAVALTAAALIAALVPAYRATRVSARVALDER